MKGVAKCRKWGGLGWLGVNRQPSSLKIAPFNTAHMTSCSFYIVNSYALLASVFNNVSDKLWVKKPVDFHGLYRLWTPAGLCVAVALQIWNTTLPLTSLFNSLQLLDYLASPSQLSLSCTSRNRESRTTGISCVRILKNLVRSQSAIP